MDDVAMMLITDEQFDFGLVFSPTSSEQDSSHGDVEDSAKKPKPRKLTALKSASEERSLVTCAADSPISEAAFMQIFSDANNIASDIENCRPPVVSCWDRLGSDDCVSSGNTSAVDNDSFQLLPSLRQAVPEVSEKAESVEELTENCDEPDTHSAEVADLRSRLERVKSQSRSAAANIKPGPVDEGVTQVVDSDRCNVVPDCKASNAEERPKKDSVRQLKPNSDAAVNAARRRSNVVEPVKSRRRSSAIQKPQNAPVGNRGPANAAKPVGRASSLRRIPSFQRGVPSKRRDSKQNSDFNDVTGARTSAPRVDTNAVSSNVETASLSGTPPHCQPPPVKQGTITKDQTRRLEKVAGPDMPVGVDKVQNAKPTAAPRNVPVRHRYSSDGIGGAPKCAAPVASQKPGLPKKRASIGPSAVTTRSGVNPGKQIRKSLSAASLPSWGAALPPKAAPLKAAPPRAAPPKAALPKAAPPRPAPPRPAPPKAALIPHEPRPGAPVKRLSLLKPAIKKPMTKLELIKPASLLSRPASAVGKTGLSRAVSLKGRPPGKGAGPLKATLPMAAVTQRGEGKNDTSCLVGGGKPELSDAVAILLTMHVLLTVTKATVTRSSANGLGVGPATLLSTPVNQDKCIQRPKRLLLATPPQGNRNSSASSGTPVSLRRSNSFLPTPTKRGSYMSGSSTRSSRHPSSSSSISSSMTSGVFSEASVTRALVDLNGLDLNSPSSLKLRRPRVLHTPVNKENIDEPAATSLWSPVPRPRVLSREDEVIQCTKHNAPKT